MNGEVRQEDCILLASSNATNTYMRNALAFLSWPLGWVAHVRYQTEWVNQRLLESLMPKSQTAGGASPQLVGKRVLAAYMYQARTASGEWAPTALYPLRYETLIEAYRVGAGMFDIAHFYFQLGDFYVPQDERSGLDPLQVLGGATYAGLVSLPRTLERTGVRGPTAQERLESIRPEHLTYQPDASDLTKVVRYYPVICEIGGLRRAGRPTNVIVPKFLKDTRTSAYELVESEGVVLDFSFYVPKWCSPPAVGSEVTLSYDEDAFSTTSKRSLSVASRYDEQAWLIVPAGRDREVTRELVFETHIRAPADYEPADLVLTMPVTVKPRKWRRVSSVVLDVVAALGLAVGTGALALTVSPPTGWKSDQLLLISAAGYAVWVVLSVLVKLWRPQSGTS